MPGISEMTFSAAYQSLDRRSQEACYADARKVVRAVRNAYQFRRNMALSDPEEYLHDAWEKLVFGASETGELKIYSFPNDIQNRIRKLLTKQSVFLILQDITVRQKELVRQREYLDEDDHDSSDNGHSEPSLPALARAKEKERDGHIDAVESDHDNAARLAVDRLVEGLSQRRTKIRRHAVELIKLIRDESETLLDQSKDRKVSLRRITIPPPVIAQKLGLTENEVTKIKAFIRKEAQQLGYGAIYSFFAALDEEIDAAKYATAAPANEFDSDQENQSAPALRRACREK